MSATEHRRNSLTRRFARSFSQAIAFATLVAIVVGVSAYIQETRIWEEERAERKADGVNRAWSIITTHAPGNSGKGPAIEFLSKQGVPLTGIDLSCKTMGGGWDEAQLRCQTPTYLSPVNLTGAVMEGSSLEGVNLKNSNISNTDLEGTGFSGSTLDFSDLTMVYGYRADFQRASLRYIIAERANFHRAKFSRADLTRANLFGAGLEDAQLDKAVLARADLRSTVLEDANLRHSRLNGADLSNAWLYDASFAEANLSSARLVGAYVEDAYFGRANVSGADFSNTKELGLAIFPTDPENSAWAYSGNPPVGLSPHQYVLCDKRGFGSLQVLNPCREKAADP
ncbi:MAG: pentapeptide repeat-containing protein [Pseudomonadota bacterium]